MTAEDASRIRARAVPLPVGTYRYDVRLDRWSISQSARAILGIDRATPVDTALVLGLLPMEDRDAVLSFVRDALEKHAPFSSQVALDTPSGGELVVVGEGEYDADGSLLAVHGQVVDVRPVGAEQVKRALDAKVAEVVANRATIEQAKGALSLAYGFDEDAAIALLRWWSSHRNIKVHTLAARLVDSASSGVATSPVLRASVEQILDAGASDGKPAQDGHRS